MENNQAGPPFRGLIANRFWKILGSLSVAAFLVLLLVIRLVEPAVAYESPLLLAILNTVFLCFIPLWMAILAARSYQATGISGFLLIGSGLLFFGISSLYAGWVMPLSGGPNATVTLHNLGALAAGICQLAAVHSFIQVLTTDQKPQQPLRSYKFLYAGIALLTSMAAVLAFRGNLPVFIDPLSGASPLRQFVLVTAICLFGMAGLAFLEFNNTLKTEFAYWYGLAVLLIATGLICVLIQPSVGSLLGWTGRAAQYTGCVFLMVAFLQGRREGSSSQAPAKSESSLSFWPILDQRVKERTAALEQYNQTLQQEISERKLVEAALRESEDRFSSVFHASQDPISILRISDGAYLDVNQQFCETFELSRQQVIGKTARQLNLWADMQQRAEFLRGLAVGELQPDFETEFQTASGKKGTFLVSGSLVNIAGQDCLVTYSKDITLRKKGQRELLEAEERFNRAFRSSVIGLNIFRLADGRSLDTNEAFLTLIGYAREELLGRTAFEINLFVDPGMRSDLMRVLRETGYVRNVEAAFRQKSGEIRQVLMSMELFELNGEPAVMALSLDITERKIIEVALQKSEERLREVLENSLDSAYKRNLITDQYDYMSPVFDQLTGYTEQELKNLPIETVLTLIHPDDQPLVDRVIGLSNAGPSGATYQVEYRFRHKEDGFRWFLDRFTFLRDENGQPLARIGSFSDITLRKQIEADLQAAHSGLEQRVQERTAELRTANLALEKALRVRDEFMAAMSHELRTPLTGVIGLSQVLQMPAYGALSEKQFNAVVNIEKSGNRLLSVINDVLDYSLLQSGSLVPALESCSLTSLCQNTLNAINSEAVKKQQHIQLFIQPEQINIITDEGLLNKILLNLLHNACKFTPAGGEIGLEVTTDQAARQVTITVWDTGIGIDERDFARLFQPFVQLDARLSRRFEGAGLGLALVKLFAQLLGSSVDVTSTLGQGSRFTVTLPWNQ